MYDIVADEDGDLNEAEIQRAKGMGMLSSTVIKSIDVNGDGRISKAELSLARETARKSLRASIGWR